VTHRPYRTLRRAALGLLLALPASAAPPEAPDPRTTMAQLVGELNYLLPLSLDDARFGDPARREAVQRSLDSLARSGEQLERHGSTEDASFDFLSRSLARDTREIAQRYAQGRIAEARFLLHQVTEDCVACHSRLPDVQPHPLGRILLKDDAIAALPVDERVKIELAMRQFDRARASFEALFRSPDFSTSDLDLMGHFDAYLELCLRVERDLECPSEAFERLAARADTRPPLRRALQAWLASLRELQVRDPAADGLAEARALLRIASDRARFPDDRGALVYYVAASSELYRYVAEASSSPPQRAEAYYLLGVIESHVGRSFWLSQTEHFLEAAIREAPGAPWAPEAYALLEEFVVSGYTGSGGGEVPEEVRTRLATLRSLMDAAAD
jgi:hypothetical protein